MVAACALDMVVRLITFCLRVDETYLSTLRQTLPPENVLQLLALACISLAAKHEEVGFLAKATMRALCRITCFTACR